MNRINIYNANLITPFRIIKGSIMVSNRKIAQISEESKPLDGFLNIDAANRYVAPGFIDLHVHGGGGFEFMDAVPDAFYGAAQMHASHGTTSMLCTTLAAPIDDLKNVFDAFKVAKKRNSKGSNLLGMHLEGPYYASSQKGSQNERSLVPATRAHYEKILSLTDDIKIWSAAPEINGVPEFGRYISQNGIIAAIGHTDGLLEDVRFAMECGFTHVTHLYSAMSSIRRINAYRYGGVLEAALLFDELTVELIADGSHVPIDLIKLALKNKSASTIALITDALRPAGLPSGEYTMGSGNEARSIIVEDNVGKLADRSAFAGSVAGADMLIRNMTQNVGISLPEAVQMMTHTPASIINIAHKKGMLSTGLDADIVIFDKDINIFLTIVGGDIVYKGIHEYDSR